jgi:hypothetical protein
VDEGQGEVARTLDGNHQYEAFGWLVPQRALQHIQSQIPKSASDKLQIETDCNSEKISS